MRWSGFASDPNSPRSSEAAVERYFAILRQGSKPSTSILLSALKACGSLNDIRTGTRIHQELQLQNQNNIFVANSLIDMYCKCGSLEDAQQIFDKMSHRSLVSWNTMIAGYAQSGRGELALQTFSRLRKEGFMPDSRTFVAALKGCTCLLLDHDDDQSKKMCLETGRALHKQASSSGHDSNIFVASRLLDLYAKCGCMREARSIFDKMQSYDSVAWNSIILGYAQAGEGEAALELFKRMQDEEFKPDDRTFVAAFKACSCEAEKEEATDHESCMIKVVSLEKAMAVHSSWKIQSSQQQQQHGQEEMDVFVASALVDLYSKCGSMADAFHVFEKMKSGKDDVVSWNALILGYVQAGEGEIALELFFSQQQRRDSRTYVAALKACSSLAQQEAKDAKLSAKALSLERGMAVHSQLTTTNSKTTTTDMFVESALVDMYSKCGSIADALGVFRRMERRDVVCWNAIISGHVQSQEHRQALDLFYQMLHQKRIQPDAGTLTAALKACGSLADLEACRRIHSHLDQEVVTSSSSSSSSDSSTGLNQNQIDDAENKRRIRSSLISVYGKCGSMAEARQVFDSMEAKSRDAITWSSLIAGYSQEGNSAEVFRLLKEMEEDERLQIDGVTFLSVLTLCCRAGLVERGREVFGVMCGEYGIAPGIEHFTCMVELLGRANELEEGLAMVRGMPFEGDVRVWTVLLDACCKWKNARVGRVAFESIVRLDAKQAAAYVLLANTFGGPKTKKE